MYYTLYISCFLGAAAAALAVTPLVIRLARAAGVLDQPGLRKVHRVAIPRLGGVAIAGVVLLAGAGLFGWARAAGGEVGGALPRLAAMLAIAAGMFVVGLVDDLCNLRAWIKLLAQFAAAAAACASGILIQGAGVETGAHIAFGAWSWPVTMLWIVGVVNAVNLVDGLDGLAAGVASIACCVLALVAAASGQVLMAGLLLALLGSLGGFLVFNFHPARVFMGDSGTYFVGFILATGSIVCQAKVHALTSLALPILVLAVPILDLLFSVLRRLLRRRSIMAPDRGHIHHQLLRLGLRQPHAVCILYAAALAAGGLAWLAWRTSELYSVIIFAATAVVLAAFFWAAGCVPSRRLLAVLRWNLAIRRQERAQRRIFEDAQLRLEEAGSLHDWWRATCRAAEDLGFRRLAIRLPTRAGSTRALKWRRRGMPPGMREVMRMSLPVCDRRARARLVIYTEVCVNGSLEDAGRRAALFDRLMEEFGLRYLKRRLRAVSRLEAARPGDRRRMSRALEAKAPAAVGLRRGQTSWEGTPR